MSAAVRIAEFVTKLTVHDCPDAALAQVRRATLDSVGVMLAGASEPSARAVRAVARLEGALPLCTVVGTPFRTSPTWASLANGVAGHAHDFDDTSFALMGHPSVPLLATVLACAETEPTGGADVVTAYLAGFEVDVALGLALNPEHYARGWHATSSIGTLGCAAAAARLLRLDVGQTAQALAVAASLASGLKENFGSMTKPYHAGHAARNGVLAALLAREGLSASPSALEGRQGYAAAFCNGTLAEQAFESLGRGWQIVTSGIAIKPYPSCALTHAAIDALLALRAEYDLGAHDIADVQVGVHRVVPDVLRYEHPSTPLERKFSMQFCAAAALADGAVTLDSFDDQPPSKDTQALLPRVRMVIDPTLPDRLEQHAWSRVTVRLRDGRTLTAPPRGAVGHPDSPLTDGQLRDKFVSCARRVLGREEASTIIEQISHLEQLPDVRVLTSHLAATID